MGHPRLIRTGRFEEKDVRVQSSFQEPTNARVPHIPDFL